MSALHDPEDPTAAQAGGPVSRSIPTDAAGPGEVSGQTIGRYRLLEKLGEGGMGTVWMAQQSEPVKRRVALKIIKLGMDTREVVARFEVERQALALMDHPHIAKVLDAGATQSGRPYFVMELVRGVPITSYCDQAKLGLRERLELFSKVCHALQHAHHKGIIHRDVKPSNILVALQDGVPQPKVIDFGIAKATSSELTQQTLYTKLSQVIGTPEYMAPEQTDMGGLDIDTRADVYSLGVLLYELLTGTKPFDLQKSITAGFDEVLRTIREDDPAKPSTRISTLGARATGIAANRHTQTQALSKGLRGDLDWIVMKALEKDRTRRYETASGFAEDIANYLNDEPVDAAPPSTRYRLKKLLRRRKKTVLSLAVIALLLIAGSVGTGIGWWRTSLANASLDVALGEKAQALVQEEEQRLLAEGNAERARSAEAQARQEAERAIQAEASAKARAAELEQVAAFQSEQLADLDVQQMGVRLQAALEAAVAPQERGELATFLAGINFTDYALQTLRDNLFERTIEAIDRQFVDQPLVQARLLQSTANTWRRLGLLESALAPQRRALELRQQELGDEHPDTMASKSVLGNLLQEQGKLGEAEKYFRADLEFCRSSYGDEHIFTLDALSNMGNLLLDQGKHAEAEPFCRESMDTRRRLFGVAHDGTLAAITNMAEVLKLLGHVSEAEAFFRESLTGLREQLGDGHRETLTCLNNLGVLLKEQGRLEEAEAAYLEVIAGYKQLLGEEHPDTLLLVSNMASVLFRQGKYAEALACSQTALEGQRRSLGNDHTSTLASVKNTASIWRAMGEPTKAEPFYWEAFASSWRVLGKNHPRSRLYAKDLESFLVGRLESARSSGEDLAVGAALLALGSFQLQVADHQEAELVSLEALDLLFSAAPEGDQRPWQAQANLGLAMAGQGRFEAGEPLLLEAVEGLLGPGITQSKPAARIAATATTLQQLSEFYAAWDASKPGKGHDAKAAEWQTRLEAWTTAQPNGGAK